MHTPSMTFITPENTSVTLDVGAHTFDTPVTISRVTGSATAGGGDVSMTVGLDADGNELNIFSISAKDYGSGMNRRLGFGN